MLRREKLWIAAGLLCAAAGCSLNHAESQDAPGGLDAPKAAVAPAPAATPAAAAASPAPVVEETLPEIPLPPIQTKAKPLPPPGALPSQPGMPDPLLDAQGNKIDSPRKWAERREEIKKTLAYYATGQMPPAPGNVSGKELKSETLQGGKVKYSLVHLNFGPGGSEGFDVALFEPASGGPFPYFVFASFSPAPGSTPLPTLPRSPMQGRGRDALRIPLGIPEPTPAPTPDASGAAPRGPRTPPTPAAFAEDYKEVLARGYAILTFNYQDAGEDSILREKDGSWAYRHTRFVKDYPDCDWGLLACWTWGISRCVDFLEQRPAADKEKLIAIGHSRLGKAVLVAGAFEERLAMVVPAGSAGGGVGAYRFSGGGRSESFDLMVKKYPNWYSPHLREFSGKNDKLPFDAHWFAALVAPRALFSVEGKDDYICSPLAMRKTFEGAAPVYEMFNAKDKMGIYYADHGHALQPADWGAVMDFADGALRGKPSGKKFDQFPPSAYDGSLTPPTAAK